MRENPGAPAPTLGDVLRTVLAVGAILPGLVAGVFTALVTGDRRLAFNRATRLWGRQGTRAAGIRLRVAGAERLRVRPAIFTINHQSGIDPILVCALLQEDFVAVAKSEIRKNPVLGPAFAFVGTVFVERDRGRDPVAAMRPAVEACEQGLALALAPVTIVSSIMVSSLVFRFLFSRIINRDYEIFGIWVVIGIMITVVGSLALTLETAFVFSLLPEWDWLQGSAKWRWPAA